MTHRLAEIRRHCMLLVGLCLLQTGMALAHEIHHAIEKVDALAIRLTHAGGEPFAFAAFEAYPEGNDTPAQVGRTDAHGRVVLVQGETRRWRVKAFSADGHGVDLYFDAPSVTPVVVAVPPIADSPNRASLLLFGFSILLALFGAWQLWPRRKP